jgi:hypothetical protein
MLCAFKGRPFNDHLAICIKHQPSQHGRDVVKEKIPYKCSPAIQKCTSFKLSIKITGFAETLLLMASI